MTGKAPVLLFAISLAAPPAMTATQQAAPPAQGESRAKKPGNGGIGGTPGMKKSASAAKRARATSRSVTGTVSVVRADSLTVRHPEGDTTFRIDRNTVLANDTNATMGSSASGKSGSTDITKMVKSGDTVVVRYTSAGDTKTATTVSVRKGGS